VNSDVSESLSPADCHLCVTFTHQGRIQDSAEGGAEKLLGHGRKPTAGETFVWPLDCCTWLLVHFQKKKWALYPHFIRHGRSISWHVFHFSRHERACRHVQIGRGYSPPDPEAGVRGCYPRTFFEFLLCCWWILAHLRTRKTVSSNLFVMVL